MCSTILATNIFDFLKVGELSSIYENGVRLQLAGKLPEKGRKRRESAANTLQNVLRFLTFRDGFASFWTGSK